MKQRPMKQVPMKQRSGRSRTSPAKKSKRAGERIFDVAADLFYRQSIRSVGVETIVEQAGVSKISLYRSFASKDDLIVAYLENRNAEYWKLLDRMLERHRNDPRAQLRALIGYIADRTTTPGYRGCPFINYAAEFPDPSHPGHRVAATNKTEMRRRLVALIEAIGIAVAAHTADAIFLLIDGAYASSQTLGGRNGPAKAALWAAEALIDSALSAPH
jgi:AcrR family transcriptional regulator